MPNLILDLRAKVPKCGVNCFSYEWQLTSALGTTVSPKVRECILSYSIYLLLASKIAHFT